MIYGESVVDRKGERVIKATVTFMALVRRKIILYHLKAYIYDFIFTHLRIRRFH